MPILYNLIKNTSWVSKANGKYFARVSLTGEMDIERMAEIIQANCSLKRSDVYAVLTEMVDVMGDALKDGQRVYIRGLGTFKPTISSRGADSRKDFTDARNIRSVGVSFTPQRTRRGSRGRCTIDVLQGATVANVETVAGKPKME